MRKHLLSLAMTAVVLWGMAVPRLHAEDGNSVTFEMVRPAGATCLAPDAHARVTIRNFGSVQNMHVEVFGLTPKNTFTLFIDQHALRPNGVSWYQGEIVTNGHGHGVGDFAGIFSPETFVLSADGPIQLAHLGIWFADANDAVKAGCSGIVTPFDGDHEAGILVLSTANFPDDHGPLMDVKEEE